MTKLFTLHFLLFSTTLEYYRIDTSKPTVGDLMKNTNLDTCTRLCGREPACKYMKSFNNFCLISSQISTSGIFSQVVPFVYEKCESVSDLRQPSETIWRKPVYQFVYDQSGHFSPVVSPRRIVFSTTARKKIKITVTFSGQCDNLTKSKCKMYCMESGSTVRMDPKTLVSSASRTVHVYPKCRTIVTYLSPSTVTGKACSSDFNITLVSSPPESVTYITADKGTSISNTASPSFLPSQTSKPTRDISNVLMSTPSKITEFLYSEFPDLRKDITTDFSSSQIDRSTSSVDSKIAVTSGIYDADYKSETERNNNVNAFKSLNKIATVSFQSPDKILTTSPNFHETSITPSQAPGASFSLSQNRVKPSASSLETAKTSVTSKVTHDSSRNIISTSLQKVKNTTWLTKQTLYTVTSQYPGSEHVTSSINPRQVSESSGTDLPTSPPSTSGNTSKLSEGAIAAVSTGSFAILVLMVVVLALMCRLFRRNSDVTYTGTSTNVNIKAIDLSRCRLNQRYFQTEVTSTWRSSQGHWDNNAMSY